MHMLFLHAPNQLSPENGISLSKKSVPSYLLLSTSPCLVLWKQPTSKSSEGQGFVPKDLRSWVAAVLGSGSLWLGDFSPAVHLSLHYLTHNTPFSIIQPGTPSNSTFSSTDLNLAPWGPGFRVFPPSPGLPNKPGGLPV